MGLTKKEKTALINTSNAKELERVTRELAYYKSEHSKQQGQIKKLYKDTASTELIVNAIAQKNITIPPYERMYTPIRKKDIDEEIVILLLSDLHIGERVNKEEMGGLGEYDLQIFKERIQRLTRSVTRILSILKKTYKLPELRIYGLGDFVNGLIHEELVETADGDIIDWLYESGGAVVAQCLLELSSMFRVTKFIGVVGNHGEIRNGKKKVYKRKYINWDYILYRNMQFMCAKDKHLEFTIPKSFFHIDKVFNHNFLLLHGDNIKCFLPGTKVTTSDLTSTPIENISVGTNVLSSDGKFREVTNVFEYEHNGEVTIIDAYGLPKDGLKVTPNHKIAAVPRQRVENLQCSNFQEEDIKAGHLSKGDYLVIPTPRIESINEIVVSDYVNEDIIKKQRKKIPPVIKDLDAFAYILGQYLADGSLSNDGYSMEIAYNSEEVVFWTEFEHSIKSVFNKKTKYVVRNDLMKRCQRVHVHNVAVVALVRSLCGTGSHTKKLHPDLLKLPVSAKKQLIIGYLRGDGHTSRYEYHRNYLTHKVVATTCSKNLGNQLFWMARMAGYSTCLKERTCSGKLEWVVSFYGDAARDLGGKTQRNYEAFDDDVKSIKGKLIGVGDKTYVQIKNVYREHYTGKKYDLEIKDLHYYTANCCIVHNSWAGIPWYGIQRTVTNFMQLMARKKTFIHYVTLGHFHNTGALQTVTGEMLLNGSLIGGNEFSLGALVKASDPYQMMFGVHPRKGITFRYNLKV